MSVETGRSGAFRLLTRFRRDRRGATAIEYALIAVGIAIAIVLTVNAVGVSLKANFYDKVDEGTRN